MENQDPESWERVAMRSSGKEDLIRSRIPPPFSVHMKPGFVMEEIQKDDDDNDDDDDDDDDGDDDDEFR